MMVSPWDKGQIKDIERAITDSQLPFSLSVGDMGVRVHIPQMTTESKTKILKLVKEKLEDARVKIRNIRQDSMKSIDNGKENGDYSEDAQNNFKEELQKKVANSNKKLEEIYNAKEKDIMSI